MADFRKVMYRGDTFILPVIITLNGDPVDLTDAIIRFTLGPIILVSPGNWDSETVYEVTDEVTQDGFIYICIEANTDEEPPNVEYWEELETEEAVIDRTDVDGAFTITIPFEFMDGISVGTYWFDVEITNGGIRQTYFVGELIIADDVSKDPEDVGS